VLAANLDSITTTDIRRSNPKEPQIMNPTVKTNLAAAAVAMSLSVVAHDAANNVPATPTNRQFVPSDFAARGRELVQQFAMSFGSQPFGASMGLPRP
jgi:hypothetical protein